LKFLAFEMAIPSLDPVTADDVNYCGGVTISLLCYG
jgi:hypothetical protein